MDLKDIRQIQRSERTRTINAILERSTLMMANNGNLQEFNQWLMKVFGHELDNDAIDLLDEWHCENG